MSALTSHREAVDDAIRSGGHSWTEWPMVVIDAPLDRHVQLSALILLLSVEGPSADPSLRATAHSESEAIVGLQRRRLPWTDDFAVTAVRLVIGRASFDAQRVRAALWGAEQACIAGPASESLVAALRDLRTWLELQPMRVWHVPEMRTYADRVLALATPAGVLDLSLIKSTDAWGRQAVWAARARSAADIAPLVRELGRLGPRRPSQTWRRAVSGALGSEAAVQLVHEWLSIASETDVVEPDEHARNAFSTGMLYAHGNDDLVRAAVYAAELLPESEQLSELLGMLARRGAALGPVPGTTTALCLKVASAAIDSLIARGHSHDERVLQQLLEDLSRRDLLRRIGKHLGREAQAEERSESERKFKESALWNKAAPEPPGSRLTLYALSQRHFVPVLRSHGFKGSGRTFRRIHSDRIDVVSIGMGWTGGFSFGYGAIFIAGQHPDLRANFDPKTVTVRDLHASLLEMPGTTDAEISSFVDRLEAEIIPFLDMLGSYEFVRSFATRGVGIPLQSEVRGPSIIDPMPNGYLARMAVQAGDRETAIQESARLLNRARMLNAEHDNRYSGAEQYWAHFLARAQQLE